MGSRGLCVALLLAGTAGAQQLPFKVEMTPARLSNHQRLKSTITVRIDGRELAKRSGPGHMDVEIEIVDNKGIRYRSEGKVSLEEVDSARRDDVFFSQDVLVLPGHYTAYVSVGDTASGEGGAARHSFYAPPLPEDPLPRAWRDLPAVEFLPQSDAPEKWYQPTLNGRLHLPVDTSQAVKIDVLINATATEATGISAHINDLNMGTLLPALKALAQIDPLLGSVDVTLLDLTRRRVIFQQGWVRELDWNRLRDSLTGSDPNLVDVKSLANREQRAEFFLSEVSKHIEAALAPDEPPHVLIVLSGPMVFGEKVTLHPIATAGNENCKVFYIRYAWGLARPDLLAIARGTGAVATGAVSRGVAGAPTIPGQNSGNRRLTIQDPMTQDTIRIIPEAMNPSVDPQDDYLEATLKPLKPRLFHVETPMAFRRALAELLAEIAKL